MGKTHAKRMEARGERLKQMPRKERFAKSAEIKKREGRVLDANEKRAIKMKGNHGAVMRAWEILRASADKREEKLEAMKHQAKMHGANEDELALMKEDFENATGGRDAAVAKVLVLLKSKFEEMARTPTGSRVIQSCIKFGTNEQRQQILMLFTPKFTDYCTDGFAHFAVEGLIRHATKPDFKSMLSMVLNVMSALATHKCGLRVVNALYNHKLCSATEKHLLVLGIFKDSVAVMKGWKGYPILEDIIEGEPGHRRRLVSALFDVTDKLVTQKEAVDYPFVQRLLCVLFTRGAREQIEELAATLKTNLIPIAQSRDGARLASLVFGVLPPKSRKVVLQAVAQNFLELATGKYSPPFLMRCFDLTYDPQMSAKYLTAPLVKDIGPISGSPYGCRVVLHLLTPDGDRKARVMLPGFEEHNLYSRSNASWNEHTWYDEQMNEETVRICEHDAESNHMPSLAAIGKAFCDVVCSVKGLENNKTLKGFVARIAAEMYFVHENEDKYRSALGLTESQMEQLRTLRSNKDRKLDDDEEAEAAEEALPTPAKKKHLPEAAAATRKTPVAAAAPPAKAAAAAAKPEAAATPKAKSPASSKQAVATTPASQRKGPSVADRSTVLDLDGDDDAVVEVSARQSTTAAPPPRKSSGSAPAAAAPRPSKQLPVETPTRKSALKGGNDTAPVSSPPSSASRKSVRILDAI